MAENIMKVLAPHYAAKLWLRKKLVIIDTRSSFKVETFNKVSGSSRSITASPIVQPETNKKI
jgi:hypothetical protein